MTAKDRESMPRPTPGIVAGIWKFDMDKVSAYDLCELALEWRLHEHGLRYQYLHVRQCSEKQWGIGFQVDLIHTTSRNFFSEMTDKLRRRFGNDFVGWDYSSHGVWDICAQAELNTSVDRSKTQRLIGDGLIAEYGEEGSGIGITLVDRNFPNDVGALIRPGLGGNAIVIVPLAGYMVLGHCDYESGPAIRIVPEKK